MQLANAKFIPLCNKEARRRNYIYKVLWMKEIQFAVAKAIKVSNNFSVSHVKEGKLEDLLLIFIH
jgi:hypothetical protein